MVLIAILDSPIWLFLSGESVVIAVRTRAGIWWVVVKLVLKAIPLLRGTRRARHLDYVWIVAGVRASEKACGGR